MTSGGPTVTTPCPVSRTEAELQLERVLCSVVFRRAQRSQRFLRYLVESALARPPVAVKEYTIAVDVFGHPASYDPSVDASVRVEAGRLRNRLREYYDEAGRTDPVLIHVPKGGYAAVLSLRSPENTEAALPAGTHTGNLARMPAPVANRRRTSSLPGRRLVAGLLGFVFLTLGGIAGGRRLVLALSRRTGH